MVGGKGAEKEAIQSNMSPGSSVSCYATSHSERAKEGGWGFRDIVILQISPLGIFLCAGWERGEEGFGSKRLTGPK